MSVCARELCLRNCELFFCCSALLFLFYFLRFHKNKHPRMLTAIVWASSCASTIEGRHRRKLFLGRRDCKVFFFFRGPTLLMVPGIFMCSLHVTRCWLYLYMLLFSVRPSVVAFGSCDFALFFSCAIAISQFSMLSSACDWWLSMELKTLRALLFVFICQSASSAFGGDPGNGFALWRA